MWVNIVACVDIEVNCIRFQTGYLMSKIRCPVAGCPFMGIVVEVNRIRLQNGLFNE